MDSEAAAQAKPPLWLRYAGLAVGAFFLVWLPIEDLSIYAVLLLAGAGCSWLLLRYSLKHPQLGLPGLLLAGGLAGLAVTPLAMALVIFKSGLHAHGFLEFSGPQLRQILSTTPGWLVAGLLLGPALYYLNQPDPSSD